MPGYQVKHETHLLGDSHFEIRSCWTASSMPTRTARRWRPGYPAPPGRCLA